MQRLLPLLEAGEQQKAVQLEREAQERQMKRVKSAAQRMMNGKVSSAWNR